MICVQSRIGLSLNRNRIWCDYSRRLLNHDLLFRRLLWHVLASTSPHIDAPTDHTPLCRHRPRSSGSSTPPGTTTRSRPLSFCASCGPCEVSWLASERSMIERLPLYMQTRNHGWFIIYVRKASCKIWWWLLIVSNHHHNRRHRRFFCIFYETFIFYLP